VATAAIITLKSVFLTRKGDKVAEIFVRTGKGVMLAGSSIAMPFAITMTGLIYMA